MKTLKFNFLLYFLPALCFIVLVYFFMQGLQINPQILPSPLLNKQAPSFSLPELLYPQKKVTQAIFKGQVSLLNVWASWCEACAEEQPLLNDIAHSKLAIVYGLNYKDTEDNARAWLNQYGNPFQKIAFDALGNTAINFGVYGTPETFLIDKKGIIRYKQVGIITPELWQQTLLPLINKLKNEND